MTNEAPEKQAADQRKPRIALMGEFSAGKSTLANIIMEQPSSPIRVTATQLPPIWYAHGDGPPIRIDLDGNETPIEGDLMTKVSPDDTRAVRVFMEADVLEICDIIDMPGSSDPNIAAEVWQAMLPMADAVIWCTPATQAWRQSEAAIWDDVPIELHDRSILLLTRFDKVRSTDDGARVLSRVKREVDGLFQHVFPVALVEALEAGEDEEVWQASGMDDFCQAFLQTIEDLEKAPAIPTATPAGSLRKPVAIGEPAASAPPATRASEDPGAGALPNEGTPSLRVQKPAQSPDTPKAEGEPPKAENAAPSSGIVPRRVTQRPTAQTPRPRRSQSANSLI